MRDRNENTDPGEGDVETEDYVVTFDMSEGASVNVYYKQDYTKADEEEARVCA